jgi:hypothetical protein
MTYASIRTARKSKHWKTRQANAHHAVKLSLSIFALFAAAMTLATPAHAQNYPWCAIYSGRGAGGGTNCGFVSYAQCMATASRLGQLLLPEHTIRTATRPASAAALLPVLTAALR